MVKYIYSLQYLNSSIMWKPQVLVSAFVIRNNLATDLFCQGSVARFFFILHTFTVNESFNVVQKQCWWRVLVIQNQILIFQTCLLVRLRKESCLKNLELISKHIWNVGTYFKIINEKYLNVIWKLAANHQLLSK